MKDQILRSFIRTYKLDLSEFREDFPVIQVTCEAISKNGNWECDLIIDTDEVSLSPKELKAIKKTVQPLFYSDLKSSNITDYHWRGEKKNPLLQVKAGDSVKYNGEVCVVAYVLPEREKCGLKSPSGRLLNNITFQELEANLLKK